MPRQSPWQGRLSRDLARAEPVHYRQVPGNRQLYYNPAAPSSAYVSQHYVLRVYLPAVEQQSVEARQQIRERSDLIRQQNREKRAAIRQHVTDIGLPATRAELDQLVRELKYWQFTARRLPLGSSEREDALAADGDYAQILVRLGRRLPTDTFPVGMSPAGHINNTVLPALMAAQGRQQ